MHSAPALRAAAITRSIDKIAFARLGAADAIGLVARPHMQRAGIRGRIDRNRAQPEALGGTRDAAGDFAAVGDEDGAEHGGSIEQIPKSGHRFPAFPPNVAAFNSLRVRRCGVRLRRRLKRIELHRPRRHRRNARRCRCGSGRRGRLACR